MNMIELLLILAIVPMMGNSYDWAFVNPSDCSYDGQQLLLSFF